MGLIWWLSLALAAPPTVSVQWHGARSKLLVLPESGTHVAPDAPVQLKADIASRPVEIATTGKRLALGLDLGEVRSRRIRGLLSFSVCESDGSACRGLEVSFEGLASNDRKGEIELQQPQSTPVQAAAPSASSHVPSAADDVLSEARARAGARDVPVLIDFGAVWCPPCQLLDAQVLHASPVPSALSGVEIASIDVDLASSWSLKHTYQVRGYPSLVLIDPADGAVVDVMEGYTDKDTFLSWLENAVALWKNPSEAGAERKAARAWSLANAGQREQAQALLAQAPSAVDSVIGHMVGLVLTQDKTQALWLAEHARARIGEWISTVGDALLEDAQVSAALQEAIAASIAGVDADTAADLIAFSAQFADSDTERKLRYASAAAVLRAALTGQPALDKGRIVWLAELEARAGKPAAALGRLEYARSCFPDEPTFHRATARMMLDLDMAVEARIVAERAMQSSWGDNALMSGAVLVDAWLALGETDRAREVVEDLLNTHPAPPEGLDVRTTRLRQDLERRVTQLATTRPAR